MAELLPTPTARDWKGAASLESLEKRGRIPEKDSFPISSPGWKEFPTQPPVVAEMMGFPPGWTVSPFSVKRKVHQRIRKRHRPPGSLRDIQSNRRNL
jgi:hypothetical protein